ncbi:MAG: PEP-CTERM sorting domain-containing protein [Microcystis sp.]|uniref:PEP-CTERM sorting domain-containing protein n=1 Tax=Microcystis sp. TaxID=1127 RepID=UPI00391DEA74
MIQHYLDLLQKLAPAGAILGLSTIGSMMICGSAQALTFFNNRNAFNAAAGGSLSFESFENPNLPYPQPSFPFQGGTFTVTETNGTNFLTNTLVNGAFGSFPVTNGQGALWYDDNGPSVGVFGLNPSVSAIGFDLTTRANAVVVLGGSIATVLNLTANTPQFFGVIGNPGEISQITFDASGVPLVGWDAVSFGNANAVVTPEPSTILGLLAVAGLGLGLKRQLKPSQSTEKETTKVG